MDLRDQLKHKLRNGTTEEIAASIQEIENDKAFEDKFHLQYLLSAKATLAFDLGEYDNMYNYALEAISLTKTDFDLSRIDEYVFFADEILIIEQIAVALFCKAKVMDSTEILIKLTQSLDKNYFDTEEKAKPHTSILYNLSKNFMNLKKYEECIKVCDEGIAVSKKYRDAFFIPMFMINKACCFFSAEDNDEGVKLTKKVYALLDANDRHNEISEIEAYIYNAYGVSVPFD
jgi:tetratricopeptide (TPR) repeat protein